MSQATDQHMLVPGDPDPWTGVPMAPFDPLSDQWWSMPVLPAAPIEQFGPIEPVALSCWIKAIVEAGGPPLRAEMETAVSQALGAAWRSSSARAEEAAGTGEQPEVQRHIDIVIDGLAKRDKSIVSDRDKPRLRKALDDADKPLGGRPGADAGVGRAIGTRWPSR